MSEIEDDEWGGGFDDLPEAFDVDVATVDAQDTVDISAQFFRVCARIYPDNPLHAPVYDWISSLPRTGNGNIKSISDHLVVALRLYVDTLNSGASLQLSSTLAGGQPMEQKLNPSDEKRAPLSSERYSVNVSPSRRYQQSRQLRDGLQYREAPATEQSVLAPQRPSAAVGLDSEAGTLQQEVGPTQRAPAFPARPPSRQPDSVHHTDGLPERRGDLKPDPAKPTSPSSSTQASSIPKPPVSDTDGLSFVAKLARDSDGWA